MNEQAQYDIAIVGAGPAGSSLAVRLSTAGLKVVLVERHRFPREKLCGEFISPECRPHLAELGVVEAISNAGAQIEKTTFYASSGKSAQIPSEWFGGPAIGLSRLRMDEILLSKAANMGTKIICPSTVTGVIRSGDAAAGIRLGGSDPSVITARLTVDATGRTRQLSAKTRERSSEASRARRVAFKAHFTNVLIEEGSCEIYSYPGGYGGANYVEGGVANLCFIVSSADARRFAGDPEAIVLDRVFKNSRAREALREMSLVGRWLAVPVDRYGRGEPAPVPGLIAVGDAAHFMDPFTGSGILTALESSRLASESILSSGGLDTARIAKKYSDAHALAFDRRLKFSSYLRAAAFSERAGSGMVALMNVNSRLRRRIALATRS